MNKNSLLVCIALLLVVGSAFLLRRGSEDEPRIAEATAAAPEEEAAEPGALLQPPATANNAASERVPLGPEPAPIDDAYRAALSGVSGRLVELDGRPAVGQDVALLEVFVDEWWAFLGLPERKLPPELVVARDRTGSDGRFLLKGARPSALHALSGSARSPRVPLRMIAEPLEPGRLVELGDVVLPARAALAGRIVDERGAPVAGARIRAGLVGKSAEMIFEHCLASLRPDGAVLVGDEAVYQVVLFPAWAARLEEQLGLSFATSDPEGRFELDDLPAGVHMLVADRSGYAARIWNDVSAPGERIELGDLVLQDGIALRGRLLEADGEPVRNAEVLGGSRHEFDLLALVRGSPTDGQGHFEIRGVPKGKWVVVAVRSDPGSPWTPFLLDDAAEELDLRLAARSSLAIRVTDEAGIALADASIEITPAPVFTLLAFKELALPPDLGRRLREPEPGVFLLENVQQGMYAVRASAPGRARHYEPFQVVGGVVERTISLGKVRTIAVEVVDANTALAVSQATVTLLPNRRDVEIFASDRTDAAGRAEVELPPSQIDLVLRVEHPGYAPVYLRPSAQPQDLEVRLSSGGRVHVRLPDPPVSDVLLSLRLRQSSTGVRDYQNVRFLRPNERGEAQLSYLAAGTWSYQVIHGWARDATLLWLLEESRLLDETGGQFEVYEGQTTELEVHARRKE